MATVASAHAIGYQAVTGIGQPLLRETIAPALCQTPADPFGP
ncbi:hypothetical protein OOK60_13345 [Trichothermofontia sichuanensis B231]|nr:hypothetical protein [Trichothermofontia sichuanensis]UZQ53480.1 hypothetical protein OOK60_13345 [Trichothermofontia sichuanensis B231]